MLAHIDRAVSVYTVSAARFSPRPSPRPQTSPTVGEHVMPDALPPIDSPSLARASSLELATPEVVLRLLHARLCRLQPNLIRQALATLDDGTGHSPTTSVLDKLQKLAADAAHPPLHLSSDLMSPLQWVCAPFEKVVEGGAGAAEHGAGGGLVELRPLLRALLSGRFPLGGAPYLQEYSSSSSVYAALPSSPATSANIYYGVVGDTSSLQSEVSQAHRLLSRESSLLKRYKDVNIGRRAFLLEEAKRATSIDHWRGLTKLGNEPMVNRLRDALAKQSTRIIDLLRHWDSDNDGKISRKEFRTALRRFGCPAEPSDVNKLFDKWDTDGSKTIELLELHKILRQGGQTSGTKVRLKRDTITQQEISRIAPKILKQQEEMKLSPQQMRRSSSTRTLHLKATERARVNFISQSMGVGHHTAKDLLDIASGIDASKRTGGGGPSNDGGSRGGGLGASGGGSSGGKPPLKLQRTRSGGVVNPDDLEGADDDSSWMSAQSQGARSAGYLVEILREKARSTRGEVSKKAFHEALTELGVDIDTHKGKNNAVQTLFDSLDTDQSGTIDMGELKAALSLIFEPSSDTPFERLMSTSGNELGKSVRKLRDQLSDQAARVVELYKRWDANGDGVISLSEFHAALPELGFGGAAAETVESLFSMFDTDGSGEITFSELHRMLKSDEPSQRVLPSATSHEPHDIDQLRTEMRREVLSRTSRAELRSAVRDSQFFDPRHNRPSLLSRADSAEEAWKAVGQTTIQTARLTGGTHNRSKTPSPPVQMIAGAARAANTRSPSPPAAPIPVRIAAAAAQGGALTNTSSASPGGAVADVAASSIPSCDAVDAVLARAAACAAAPSPTNEEKEEEEPNYGEDDDFDQPESESDEAEVEKFE